MAKIRFSSLAISEMSGKYGASDVIARNRGGFYTRTNNQPYSNTAEQITRRAAMKAVTQFWATLDYDEQLAWIAAAAANYWVWSVRLNNLFQPSGQMLFIKVNINVYLWNFPIRLPPPLRKFSPSDLPKVLTLEADTLTGIEVEFNNVSIPTDTVLQIWMTDNLSTGTIRPKASWFKLIAEIEAGDYSDTIDLTTEWEARFDAVVTARRIFFQSALLDVRTGRRITIEKIFCTSTGPETLKDADGNVYTLVTIGSLQFTVENWKSTKYANGDAIPNITDNTDWINDTLGAFCWYDNDIANKPAYGALYNFHAIDRLAPTGWRVPSIADWNTLITEIGGLIGGGGKLKETGTLHWLTPNTGATDSEGFKGRGGAQRNNTGTFSAIKFTGNHHSSDASVPGSNLIYRIRYDTADITTSTFSRDMGASVRMCRTV